MKFKKHVEKNERRTHLPLTATSPPPPEIITNIPNSTSGVNRIQISRIVKLFKLPAKTGTEPWSLSLYLNSSSCHSEAANLVCNSFACEYVKCDTYGFILSFVS